MANLASIGSGSGGESFPNLLHALVVRLHCVVCCGSVALGGGISLVGISQHVVNLRNVVCFDYDDDDDLWWLLRLGVEVNSGGSGPGVFCFAAAL